MATWINKTKNTTTWSEIPKGSIDFLLKEDGGFLLQENTDYIFLEQGAGETYTNLTKHTSTYTNLTKH